jgi:hypothetical protein
MIRTTAVSWDQVRHPDVLEGLHPNLEDGPNEIVATQMLSQSCL